jgi:hypothetical protein
MPEMPPDIPVDASPPEQVVPKAITLVGSVSIGLMPGEVSSVAPSGMPVGPTDAPGCKPPDMPSGEVAAMPGVGTLIPAWAKAGLEPSIAITAIIHRRLILCLLVGGRRAQAASRSGGAMNSGPTALVTV